MSIPPAAHIANIRGIPVKFPFRPYECQVTYMESVIESLQEGKNAMLESPTGTGKTLCLLAASLAWREFKVQQLEQAQLAMAEDADLLFDGELNAETLINAGIAKPRPPVIIYASRTHSQLSQVVAELHRTTYSNSLNVCVLGSRSQMCIHPIVSQVKGGMGAVNRACTTLVQKASCTFHSNSELYKNHIPQTKDIEDMIAWGRRHSACPYYVAKDQQTIADIVFVPYNYIIDPLIRKSLTMDLKGSVVILDEAHNLESVASDAASFDLSSSELKSCLTSIQQCLDLVGGDQLPPIVSTRPGVKSSSADDQDPVESATSMSIGVPGNFVREAGRDDDWTTGSADAALLKQAITDLLDEMSKVSFPAGSNAKVSDGLWLFELFENVGITADTAQMYLRTVERVGSIMSDGVSGLVSVQTSSGIGGAPSSSYASANALSSFADSLRKMFMTGVPVTDASQHFKAVLQREPISGSGGAFASAHSSSSTSKGPFERKYTYKLSFWCFYPGLAMQSLVATGIRSLIVTSGTLSPLDSFAYELSIPFPIRLENPHVIPSSQIWVGVLSTSVDGEKLNSAYTNRSDQYKQSLGRMLVNVARITPGGLLVFFPSYRMMEDCLTIWRNETGGSTNVWDQICKYKQPVIEPRESNKLKPAMQDFYRKVDLYTGNNSTPLVPPSTGMSAATTTPTPSNINGAVFFAVCRGKVSEGLDFSNQYGRTVVVTGLPLALSTDQKVKLKREYLDQQVKQRSQLKTTSEDIGIAPSTSSTNSIMSNDRPLTGADWYNQSAWRAVNQAIGRVIRHRNDYGAILFADERFVSYTDQYSQLSKWLRPHAHHIRDPGPAFQSLTKFFATNREKFSAEVLDRKSEHSLSSPVIVSTTTNSVNIPTASRAMPTTMGLVDGSALASHVGPHAPSMASTSFTTTTTPAAASSVSTLHTQVSSANARRRSLLESLDTPSASSSASANPPSGSSTKNSSSAVSSTAGSSLSDKKKKNPKAVQLLDLAKSNLDTATYQKFQAQLRRFKTENVNRGEIYKKLALLLQDSPVVLNALQQYLPAGSTAATTIGSMVTPSVARNPEPVPEQAEQAQIANIEMPPPSAPPASSAAVESNSVDLTSPARDSREPELLVHDVDAVGINPKKRPFDRVISPEETPAPKRIAPIAPITPLRTMKKIFEPPKDNILDSQPSLSTLPSSTGSQDSPLFTSMHRLVTTSSKQIEPPLQESSSPSTPVHLDSPSPSLQILSDTPAPTTMTDLTGSDEFPIMYRRASSDISPTVSDGPKSTSPTWLAGLNRRSSSGLPKPPSTSGHPQVSLPSRYSTPKKHTVDLISGQVSSASRFQPRRISPEKTSMNQVEIIPDSGPLPSDSPLFECLICAKQTSEMRTAPCGHSCCADCWQGWLAQKMECPFCRGRVRAKKLEKTPKKHSE